MPSITGIAKYYERAEKFFLVNKTKFLQRDVSINIPNIDRLLLSVEQQADLGTAALFIEEIGKKASKFATKEIKSIYGNLKSVEGTCHRSKSSPSICSKLQKYIQRAKGYSSQEQALNMIEDLEGSRVFMKPLKKLKNKEIKKMVDELRIHGEPLTPEQKVLLNKYIYNEPLTLEQEMEIFPIFEKFATPLIEKRSAEVVDTTCLSIAKHRILKNELTIEEIRKKGLLSEKLIQKLEQNYNSITPLELKSLDNYRGMHGLPEFSNNQVAKIQAIGGPGVITHSRPDLLENSRFNVTAYTKEELKELAIKESGYRTGQLKLIHANGVNGEVQVTYKKGLKVYNAEHWKYDQTQSKTNGSEFLRKYKALDSQSKAEYERYWEECYNQEARAALGLPSKKVKLPRKFSKIFSFENIEQQSINTERQAANTNFVPHFESYEAIA